MYKEREMYIHVYIYIYIYTHGAGRDDGRRQEDCHLAVDYYHIMIMTMVMIMC